MEGTGNPLQSAPVLDKETNLNILGKLKEESNVLVYAFYLFAVGLILFLLAREISLIEGLVTMLVTLCLTLLIVISFIIGRKGGK